MHTKRDLDREAHDQGLQAEAQLRRAERRAAAAGYGPGATEQACLIAEERADIERGRELVASGMPLTPELRAKLPIATRNIERAAYGITSQIRLVTFAPLKLDRALARRPYVVHARVARSRPHARRTRSVRRRTRAVARAPGRQSGDDPDLALAVTPELGVAA